MIILDTSGLFAALNERQPRHALCRAVLEAVPGPRVLSPFVLAELDYFVALRGIDAELALLDQVSMGIYRLEAFDRADVARAATLVERYRDLGIGLSDASVVVLAARYRTDRVLTLDERHFRALRTLDGGPFVLLPSDASRVGP